MCGVAPNDLTRATESKCGSWLACDDGLSVDKVSADPPLSQASQLPHFDGVPSGATGRTVPFLPLAR
ncbi:hypothetical protein PflCFBP13517_12675 [Pseudomonas fluorescens]|nr:hypothetical protein PflCFBP13517_12675 [Pseudomonas fluorescens]